jgi:hypothetical protein
MQLLNDKGWKMYYKCNCGGSERQHWSNEKYPAFEITLRPRRNTFRLLNKNMVIAGPLWIYQMEATIKKFEVYE